MKNSIQFQVETQGNDSLTPKRLIKHENQSLKHSPLSEQSSDRFTFRIWKTLLKLEAPEPSDGGLKSTLKNLNGAHVLTCEAACVLLSVAVHLALMAGQNLLHKVQHSKVLHYIVEQNCI